jgi:hypothetical protein
MEEGEREKRREEEREEEARRALSPGPPSSPLAHLSYFFFDFFASFFSSCRHFSTSMFSFSIDPLSRLLQKEMAEERSFRCPWAGRTVLVQDVRTSFVPWGQRFKMEGQRHHIVSDQFSLILVHYNDLLYIL